ncbi:MAG: DNA primase [Nitrospirota bacterium]
MKADRLLEEIKSRIDIVEFISDYVQLKKSGQNYKGLCPFHSEKTPSFMVSQSKQIFHCFGCGIGGDVVSFLMKHENLSFGEAIRYIAKKANIKITEFRFDKDLSEKRDRILQTNREAMKFFIKNLNDSDLAKAYLKKRGIEESSLQSFFIGYATDGRDALLKHLKKMGFSDSLIKDAGLAISDERGYRDVFRKRIIFPLFNYQNDVIAFGGRVMDDSLPKYLNSPETEIFKKGEALFALNIAKEEIRKKGYAIIVEGYFDAIVCHQYDFKNTVAPLGTALTSRQLQRLKSLTGKVVLVFDSDEAGIAAARRSLATLCESDFRARVLLLPEGEDPDSFLRKNGSESFKKILSGALSMIDFILDTSKGDRIETVKEALGMIALIRDLIVAEEMLRELAERSKINESVLRGELKKIKKKAGPNSLEGFGLVRAAKNKEEYLLASAIIAFPEKAEYVLSRLNIEDLKDEIIKSLLKKIEALGDKLNMRSLLDEAGDQERTLITGLSLNPGFDLEHVDRNIDDCLQTLAQKRFDERRRLAEESGDIALLNSLLREKRKLLKGHTYERIP